MAREWQIWCVLHAIYHCHHVHHGTNLFKPIFVGAGLSFLSSLPTPYAPSPSCGWGKVQEKRARKWIAISVLQEMRSTYQYSAIMKSTLILLFKIMPSKDTPSHDVSQVAFKSHYRKY